MITIAILIILIGIVVLLVALISGVAAILWALLPYIIVAYILYRVFAKRKGGDKE